MLHADTAAVSRHCGLRRSGVIMAARPPGPRPHEEETMPQPNGNHARLVDSVIRGTSRDVCAPEYVKRSWLRCVDEYGLDPESNALPAVVSSQELTIRKERSLELMSFADAEMAHLYGQLAGSGHSIILTDGDGVLLSYYGDPSFKGAASRAGLVPGAVWSERYGGTNGMGTCLLERRPLIVHREQHFLARNIGLTCCAAPIFDHRSELVAVLDASGESDRAQQHTLVLVNMSAQMIENRLFLHRFRDAFVMRFHSRPELVGTWSEGIIALDPAGAIAVAQEPESAPRGGALPSRASRSALDELDLGDASMARNIRAAKRVASRDVPILLIGETGTGKELFARALHASSERAEHAFVAVNCAAIPEALLHSEIVQAHGGTLFLDEIGELPGALQARLLQVLEKREMRLIAASPSGLEEKIDRGEFREDLFYRLQGLVLTLPRLDDRTDKRALIRHVFAQETADTPSVSLSEELIDALCAHPWRGNIRQLRNALRAMIARRSGDKLDVADLPSEYRLGARPAERGAALAETDSLNALGRAEREALLRELDLEHGNISHVARKLGVGRNTLYRKMHRLHIMWPVRKPLH